MLEPSTKTNITLLRCVCVCVCAVLCVNLCEHFCMSSFCACERAFVCVYKSGMLCFHVLCV